MFLRNKYRAIFFGGGGEAEQTTGNWPGLGAHMTASIGPQRLAGALCSRMGDVCHICLSLFVEDVWVFILENKITSVSHMFLNRVL